MEKIKDFVSKNDMSYRLEVSLLKLHFVYMEELSVLKLFKTRTFGVKQIRELISIYPDLENESGIISYECLKSYK